MNQIGGLERELLNMVEYKTEHDVREGQVDKGRRGFMQRMLGIGAAVATSGVGVLMSEDAHAYFEMKNLPPGIQIIKDEALVQAYGSMIYGGYNSNRIYDILTRTGGWVNGNIKANTPLVEPGYWFTSSYLKWKQLDSSDRISFDKRVSSYYGQMSKSMYNWAFGIDMYFKTWVAKKYGSVQETETYLLRAIFTAAGRSESDVENYKQLNSISDENLKKAKKITYLEGVMDNLKNQSKTNQLIAAWSSFFLTAHHFENNNKSKNKDSDIYYYNFQKPLIDNNIIPNIRGNYNL